MQEKRKKIVTLRQNILRKVISFLYYEKIFSTVYAYAISDSQCPSDNRSDYIPAVRSYGG